MWIITDLPMPPTVNKYHAIYNGRLIKSKEGRTFDRDIQIWMLKNGLKLRKIREEIKEAIAKGYQLKLLTYFCFEHSQVWTKDGRPKKIDTNNRLKPATDGISLVLGVDDSLFFAEAQEKVVCDGEAHIVAAIGLCKPVHKKDLWFSSKDQEPPIGLI